VRTTSVALQDDLAALRQRSEVKMVGDCSRRVAHGALEIRARASGASAHQEHDVKRCAQLKNTTLIGLAADKTGGKN